MMKSVCVCVCVCVWVCVCKLPPIPICSLQVTVAFSSVPVSPPWLPVCLQSTINTAVSHLSPHINTSPCYVSQLWEPLWICTLCFWWSGTVNVRYSIVNAVGCWLCNSLYCGKARKAELSSFSHVGTEQRLVCSQIRVTPEAWLEQCVSPQVPELSVFPAPIFHLSLPCSFSRTHHHPYPYRSSLCSPHSCWSR